MAEKRKPTFVIMLKKQGKRGRTHKLEVFPAGLWKCSFFSMYPNHFKHRYRLRLDGKWHNTKDGKPACFTRYEIRDLIWRSLGPRFWNGD